MKIDFKNLRRITYTQIYSMMVVMFVTFMIVKGDYTNPFRWVIIGGLVVGIVIDVVDRKQTPIDEDADDNGECDLFI
jgi:hypothetical protein